MIFGSGLALALALALPPAAAPAPKLVVVSWDGAPDWVVDRLLAAGELPHLARLARDGVAAEHSVAVFPSKTAPGHAALWTGCWPGASGITANAVPASLAGDATVLETRRAFGSDVLRAEPLFVTAAKAGKKVVVLSATHNEPAAPHLDELRRAGIGADRYLSFSGFEHPIAPGRVYGASDLRPARAQAWEQPGEGEGLFELTVEVGESTFYVLVFDDPDDPTAGLDSVLIRQGGRTAAGAVAAAILKPRPAGARPEGWSPPFRVRRGELVGHAFFRLFALAADGSALVLYQRKVSALGGAHGPAQLEAYLEAYPGFHDDAFRSYARGALGRNLAEGGDGTAERRVLEAVAFDTALLRRGTRFALERWRPDVLFHYSPVSDDAGHAWMGALDPHGPAHDAGLAERLWPYYTDVLRQLDGWLGEILESAPPETVVALVSDHGMTGTARDVYVNVVLERAGLLHVDGDGAVDLARTRILAADSDFFLRLNDRRFRQGAVAPEERDAVLAAAAEALLEARDPETGVRLFERVWRPRELADLGLDAGGRVGDLYFDLAPGYYPRRWPGPRTVRSQGPGGQGNHGFHPERREMHALFYVMGPGVRRGVTVPPVRHVDVAPTLAALLGIPAPAQAEGKPIEAMLAPRVAAKRRP